MPNKSVTLAIRPTLEFYTMTSIPKNGIKLTVLVKAVTPLGMVLSQLASLLILFAGLVPTARVLITSPKTREVSSALMAKLRMSFMPNVV